MQATVIGPQQAFSGRNDRCRQACGHHRSSALGPEKRAARIMDRMASKTKCSHYASVAELAANSDPLIVRGRESRRD
jgi:hypothetical protein